VLINQSRKISTSKPSVYIKSPTEIIYCFITLAVLLQTFHLKDSESCPTFKFFWGAVVGVFIFKSAKAPPSNTGKEKKEVVIYSWTNNVTVLFQLPFSKDLQE